MAQFFATSAKTVFLGHSVDLRLAEREVVNPY